MIEQPKLPVEEGQSSLKKIRELLGDISQEEFARRIGVSAQTVSRWERGVWDATLTLPQIKAFCREIESVGLSIHDIPNTFGPLPEEQTGGEAKNS